jgi:glycosyltransferase involved in cell wall biosynthesis
MLEKALIEQRSTVWKSALIGFIERRNFETAAAVHVTSARETSEARAFGFAVRRFVEIPNGVDIDAPGGAPAAGIRNITEGPPFVLFLGRINWKKGLDRLIAALPEAPQVRAVLAGNDEERYQPALESLAGGLGVQHRVVFTGEVTGADKAALLHAARALVLPSYSENFGNVVLEAMAAGTPAIVTTEVGAAEIVRHSGAGVVCDGDPAALGGALQLMLADSDRREEMRQAGRRFATQYSWPRIAEQMERLYQSILS